MNILKKKNLLKLEKVTDKQRHKCADGKITIGKKIGT